MTHCEEIIRSAVARVQAVDEVRGADTERGFWRFYVLTSTTDRNGLAGKIHSLELAPFRLHGFRRINDGTVRMEVQFNIDSEDMILLESRIARMHKAAIEVEEITEPVEKPEKKRSVRGKTDKKTIKGDE